MRRHLSLLSFFQMRYREGSWKKDGVIPRSQLQTFAGRSISRSTDNFKPN